MSEPELKVNRRLVPQFSLNNRQEPKVVAQPEVVRKAVTRFTREQLIALRKSSEPLPSMKSMAEVYCSEVQEPVCFSKLEPEDVIRIWNAASKDMAGRGRGRARGTNQHDGGDETFGNSTSELWDDGGLLGSSEGKDFDLTEISKASLQFRSDMEHLKLSDDVDLAAKEVDAMDSLIEEQENEGAVLSSEPEPSLSVETQIPAEGKKLLDAPLLTTPSFGFHVPAKEVKMDVSESVKPHVIVAHQDPVSSFLSSLPAATPISLSEVGTAGLSPIFSTTSVFPSEPLLSRKADPEWFYTDPQLQVQGPFTQENMRLWNEAGYFAKDLPIKLRQWSSFYPFKEVFPESRLAFYTIPAEPVRPSLTSISSSTLGNPSSLSYLGVGIDSRRIDGWPAERSNPREMPLAFGSDLFSPTSATTTVTTSAVAPATVTVPESHVRDTSNSNLGLLSVVSPGNTANAAVDKKPKGGSEVNKVSSLSSSEPVRSQDHKSEIAKTALGISTKPVTSKIDETTRSPSQPQPVVRSQKETGPSNPTIDTTTTGDQKSKSGWKVNEVAKNKPQSFLDIQQEAVDERKNLKEKVSPNTVTTTSATSTTVTANASPSAHPTAMSAQLKSILGLKPQQQQQQQTSTTSTTATAATATTVTKTGAWSSVTSDIPSTPLTEIMKEEINQQSQRRESSSDRQKGSTWASKIVSGGSSVSSTMTPKTPSTVTITGGKSVPKSPSRTTAPVTSNNRSGGINESDFGGKKMSKELADWCASQLKAIKGIEDVSLMEFCMSLSSAVEIRETLASNLGSSPQVTNFATEFIKYKDEGRPPSNRQNNVEVASQINSNQRKKKSSK